jgi:hypothetical protein
MDSWSRAKDEPEENYFRVNPVVPEHYSVYIELVSNEFNQCTSI